MYKNSFYFRAAHWWNKMPTYVHCIEDPLKLKKELTRIIEAPDIC